MGRGVGRGLGTGGLAASRHGSVAWLLDCPAKVIQPNKETGASGATLEVFYLVFEFGLGICAETQ